MIDFSKQILVRQVEVPSFAFATIGAAVHVKQKNCKLHLKFELGNYAQTITHTNFATATTVGTADVKTIPVQNNVRVLLNENKEFIQNETVAFINATYPILYMTKHYVNEM